VFVGVVSWAVLISLSAQSKPSSLQGAWRVTEVTQTSQGTRTVKNPPGMFLFTAKHYATLTTRSDQPRPDIPQSKTATATADELRAAWGPFTANGGTYELSGDTLTTKAIIAKNQGVMKSGNYQAFSVKMDGNTLTLVQKATDAGPSTNPISFKMTRLE